MSEQNVPKRHSFIKIGEVVPSPKAGDDRNLRGKMSVIDTYRTCRILLGRHVSQVIDAQLDAVEAYTDKGIVGIDWLTLFINSRITTDESGKEVVTGNFDIGIIDQSAEPRQAQTA